jgi:hypothetical protein
MKNVAAVSAGMNLFSTAVKSPLAFCPGFTKAIHNYRVQLQPQQWIVQSV